MVRMPVLKNGTTTPPLRQVIRRPSGCRFRASRATEIACPARSTVDVLVLHWPASFVLAGVDIALLVFRGVFVFALVVAVDITCVESKRAAPCFCESVPIRLPLHVCPCCSAFAVAPWHCEFPAGLADDGASIHEFVCTASQCRLVLPNPSAPRLNARQLARSFHMREDLPGEMLGIEQEFFGIAIASEPCLEDGFVRLVFGLSTFNYNKVSNRQTLMPCGLRGNRLI